MTRPTDVLVVLTSHAAMGATGEPTGLWLEELTTPYYVLAEAGARIEVASIAGGIAPIDPRSREHAGELPESIKRYRQDADLRRRLATTPALREVASRDFDIVFMPGGHGTMWDLPGSAELASLVARTLERGAVVAAVCHGPAGLVSARFADGRPVVAGRRVSAFTNSEEQAVGLTDVVPFLLESRLKELGARFEGAPDFQEHAVADGGLVTGQNPASSARVARLALEQARR